MPAIGGLGGTGKSIVVCTSVYVSGLVWSCIVSADGNFG